MLDIHDYIKYIIKKDETLTTISPIHIYINRVNNRLVFKIKDWYRVELQKSETMTLFGSTKKSIYKTKSDVLSFKVDEVVLAQCNLVDNQHQQKSEVLYLSMPNKSYTYLWNAEPSILVFLKTFDTEFD